MTESRGLDPSGDRRERGSRGQDAGGCLARTGNTGSSAGCAEYAAAVIAGVGVPSIGVGYCEHIIAVRHSAASGKRQAEAEGIRNGHQRDWGQDLYSADSDTDLVRLVERQVQRVQAGPEHHEELAVGEGDSLLPVQS